MTEEELLKMVTGLAPGTELEMTFKAGQDRKGTLDRETKTALMFLVMMVPQNLTMPEGKKMELYAVASSGYWDVVERTVRATIPEGFDPKWFAHRLWYGLESIQIKDASSTPAPA